MEFHFSVDLYYGCVRLLTQMCLTLTTLYPLKIPLRLIWSICSAFFYFALFTLINRSCILRSLIVMQSSCLYLGTCMFVFVYLYICLLFVVCWCYHIMWWIKKNNCEVTSSDQIWKSYSSPYAGRPRNKKTIEISREKKKHYYQNHKCNQHSIVQFDLVFQSPDSQHLQTRYCLSVEGTPTANIFLLLWPWPWHDDLRNTPRYTNLTRKFWSCTCVPKFSSKVKAFKKLQHSDRQTDMLLNVLANHAHSRIGLIHEVHSPHWNAVFEISARCWPVTTTFCRRQRLQLV